MGSEVSRLVLENSFWDMVLFTVGFEVQFRSSVLYAFLLDKLENFDLNFYLLVEMVNFAYLVNNEKEEHICD